MIRCWWHAGEAIGVGKLNKRETNPGLYMRGFWRRMRLCAVCASDIVVGENGRVSQINFIRYAGPKTSGCVKAESKLAEWLRPCSPVSRRIGAAG